METFDLGPVLRWLPFIAAIAGATALDGLALSRRRAGNVVG